LSGVSVNKTRALCKALQSGKVTPELKEWWYYRRRKVQNGIALPKEEEKVLSDYKIPWLYTRSAYTIMEEETSRKYFKWVLEKREEPKPNPENPEEHSLYRWMYRKRQKGFCKQPPRLGILPNISDKPLSREEKELDKAQILISWVLENKKIPSSKAGGEEGKLGKWLLNKRRYYSDKGLGDTISILLRSAEML